MTTDRTNPIGVSTVTMGVSTVTSVATIAALICLSLLGLRLATSIDLGYHLAYGEHFLETGEVVDHNAFLYSMPTAGFSPRNRPEPGPGCWYDEQGRYCFPNANWLSQIIMAVVYRSGDVAGLCVFTATLVVGTSLLMLWTMRRMTVPWPMVALSLLLFGFVSFSRFNLRPEVLGYVVFAAQNCLLAKAAYHAPTGAGIGLRSAVAVVALQFLFVNLHSYFILGLAISGAIFVEYLLRWAWERVRHPTSQDVVVFRKACIQIGGMLTTMAAVSFINPWTWRLAILPVETLLYLREHQIAGEPGSHPWSHILEFRRTIHENFPYKYSDYGIIVVLVLSGLGGLAALLRRQWSLLLIIGGMVMVSLSMKRNIAPAALVLLPTSLASLCAPWIQVRMATSQRFRHALIAGASVVTLILSGYFAFAITTNRFYRAENGPMRFGIGITRISLPTGAAQWLNEHLPDARIWCDMSSSSTVHFFTRPHRAVPIISNTWAYPPELLQRARTIRATRTPFNTLADDYSIDAVLLRYDWSYPLFQALAKDAEWLLLHAEGVHVLFGRDHGNQAKTVRQLAIESASFDIPAYIQQQKGLDPFVESTLLHIGMIFSELNLDVSIEAFEGVVQQRPDMTVAWYNLGLIYGNRGRLLRQYGHSAYRSNFASAERCFRKVLTLKPQGQLAHSSRSKLSDAREMQEQ